MRHRTIWTALLVLAPGTLLAQRGHGSGGGGGSGGSDLGGSYGSLGGGNKQLFNPNADVKGPSVHARDLEDINPLKLLLDKHKDLALTDDQVAQLHTMNDSLSARNKSALSSIDSLVHDMMLSPTASNDDRAKAMTARHGLMDAIASIRANDDAASKDAIAKLSPEQQTRASALLDKQTQDTEKMIRERVGGGG